MEQVQLLDEDGVDGPGVAVLDGDAVQADILTVHHGHGAGTPRDPLDLGVHPPVAVLGVTVQGALTGHDHIVHLGDVQQACKAVQGVALPARQVILVHLVLAGQHAGQDGVVGAVIIAQEHGVFFQVEGGIALEEQAGRAVASGGDIHGAALGAGGESRLQLDGVVRLAVAHQAVAGGVHKERLGLGGELQAQALALGLHAHGISGAGEQGKEGEHIGAAGIIDGFAVQRDSERVGRAEAQPVFKLKDRTAGHGADERQIHKQPPERDLRKWKKQKCIAACPAGPAMVH